MKISKITLLFLVIGLPFHLPGQKLDVFVTQKGACFMEGKDSILFYQAAPVNMYGTVRSNYIHPLYNMDGEVITENAPEDHLHQRGIYWAWHQLYIGQKRIGDGWELKDIHWDVISLDEVPQKKNEKSITAKVLWKSSLCLDEKGNEKPFLKEITTITVYPTKTNYRQFDVEVRLFVLENDMRLGGSEDEKGYGGFSARIKLEDDVQFIGKEGRLTPGNLPVKSEGWIDILQTDSVDGSKFGVVIMEYPDNPGYPNPWILRLKESMQNAVFPYPGAEAIPMSVSTPIVLKYRVLIHNGRINKENISKIHNSFIMM